MDYWYQDWLLRMVDEFKLHPRVAKLRARTAKEEWALLEKMVLAEIERVRPKMGR